MTIKEYRAWREKVKKKFQAKDNKKKETIKEEK